MSQSLLDRFDISPDDLSLIEECGHLLGGTIDRVVDCFYEWWHCQTNLNGPAKGAGLRRSGRQLTPLGQGGRTVLFEDVAAVEVTVVVEVVVD